MIAGPPRSDGESPVNTELIDIANQAPQPFPAFKDANGQTIDTTDPQGPGEKAVQAVQKFLGGQDVTKLCSATLKVCDIRKSYYQNYDAADWASKQVNLTTAECADHL